VWNKVINEHRYNIYNSLHKLELNKCSTSNRCRLGACYLDKEDFYDIPINMGLSSWNTLGENTAWHGNKIKYIINV
jgi:hypothetical protein